MSESIHTIAEQMRAVAPTVERLPLRLGGQRIDVVTNAPELVDVLGAYFSAFDEGGHDELPDLVVRAHQVEPPDLGLDFVEWSREPGKQTRKEAYCDLEDGRVVLKVRTDMQFLVAEDLRVVIGDCLAHPNQVVNFINFQFTSHLMNRRYVLCHAAGVVERGRGLALAGVSGAGKSTLALFLLSRGLSFTSNDRLLMRRRARRVEMVGVAKHPRINPGTALANPDLVGILEADRKAELEAMPRDRLWDLEEKYDALIDRMFGRDRIQLSAPVEAFVVMTWSHRRAEPACFEPVQLEERPDLLEAIMKSPGPFYQPTVGAGPTVGW